MKSAFFILLFLISFTGLAQNYNSLNAIRPDVDFENIHVKKIAEDSLQSSFIIWVKQSVKAHYHADHSESIYVLDGEAVMTLGESLFVIKLGDYITIPKGTVHSVTQVLSKQPLKVLSIQTPYFDGSDRVFKEP